MCVNTLGSTVLGLLYGLWKQNVLDPEVWQIIGSGFLGAFTTFSAFGFETYQLWIQKHYSRVLLYIFFTFAGAIIGCFLGYMISGSIGL
jgi:CrcB protein